MSTAADRNLRYRERIRKGLIQPQSRAVQPVKPLPTVVDQLDRLIAATPMPRELRVGAPCRGAWSMFDPACEGEHRTAVAERHAEAIEFCGRCPLLSTCREWLDSLPASQRPIGVVAGRVVQPHYLIRKGETR